MQIFIKDPMIYALTESVLYRPDHVFRAPHRINGGRRIEVREESVFQGARRLRADHGIKDIAVLVFASPTRPGGGFLTGAQAQEEAIARSSGLYPCIKRNTEMYDFANRHQSALGSDYISYSPKVPYFREDDGNLAAVPLVVSFITCAAPNLSRCTDQERQRARDVMKSRMRKIILVAIEHKDEALLLGAFGCGVFENDPSDVARIEKELLVDEGLGCHFKVVLNPIVCSPRNRSNLEEFQRVLARFDEQ
jgi:uncharacterized protein (TIGR02452 family)